MLMISFKLVRIFPIYSIIAYYYFNFVTFNLSLLPPSPHPISSIIWEVKYPPVCIIEKPTLKRVGRRQNVPKRMAVNSLAKELVSKSIFLRKVAL